MADIDLERKEGASVWPWIVGAVLLALVVWGLAEAFESGEPEEPEVGMEEPAVSQSVARPEEATLPMILQDPGAYLGQSFSDGVYRVSEVPTDRGFMIQNQEGGQALMAIIIDEPRERPLDITPGQRLRITGGTLRGPAYLSDIEGVPLDDDTRQLAEARAVFLVVDEESIEILQGG